MTDWQDRRDEDEHQTTAAPSEAGERERPDTETDATGEKSTPARYTHDDERVELGLALLERLEHDSLSLADVVDRIETVTSDPTVTRTILDEAELRGIIDREDGIVRPKSRQYVRFEQDVVQREGEFDCQRCGCGLSTGHFITLEAGELGPFGSSCIRKVTGRETD
ncbi:DUF5830 family protein [Natrialba hulunbeirensis]|uniref:DUF5830 family protein n=1 Tax=Natrialba hulunbeirensis TaxID=123783 RepID=UPI001F4CB533|nr:DUF5830 family protein [Natrialba hulunbeirensis]